jgi:ribose 5-phosphate isomerase A
MGLDAGPLPAADRDCAVRATAIRRAVEAAAADAGCPGPELPRKGKDGHAFVTDGGHWLIDAPLQRIPDPAALAARLCTVPGVMEHGLFIGIAHALFLPARRGCALSERL